MNLPLKDMAGQQVGEIKVSDAVFAAPINKSVMHQALLRQLSNARLGTHKVKTRGEVAGGGRKPFKQKGTGRARQGSTRAPQWIGGGTVFGPTPRKYTKQLPKKMHHAALRSALTAKAAAGQIVVLDSVTLAERKTKVVVGMLKALELQTGTVLLVLPAKNELVQRSASNLPNVKTLLSSYLNVRDILGYDTLLLAKDSMEHIENWLGTGDTSDVEEAEMPEDDAPVAVSQGDAAQGDVPQDDASDEVSQVDVAQGDVLQDDIPQEDVALGDVPQDDDSQSDVPQGEGA